MIKIDELNGERERKSIIQAREDEQSHTKKKSYTQNQTEEQSGKKNGKKEKIDRKNVERKAHFQLNNLFLFFRLCVELIVVRFTITKEMENFSGTKSAH